MMDEKKLFDAMSDIDENYIQDARISGSAKLSAGVLRQKA